MTVKNLILNLLTACNSLDDEVEIILLPRTSGEQEESYTIDQGFVVQTEEGENCVEIRV